MKKAAKSVDFFIKISKVFVEELDESICQKDEIFQPEFEVRITDLVGETDDIFVARNANCGKTLAEFDKAVEDRDIRMYVAVFNRLPQFACTVPIARAMSYKYYAVFNG